MGAGASAARAPVLCFLHADVRLNREALATLERIASTRSQGAFAFRLRIAGPRAAYRLIEAGANARSGWLGLPFGDQGLIIDAALYERVGGYPDYPVLEDVALARSLRGIAPIQLLPAEIMVSARRWEQDGILHRTVQNLSLLIRFFLGASPERLASSYRQRVEP